MNESGMPETREEAIAMLDLLSRKGTQEFGHHKAKRIHELLTQQVESKQPLLTVSVRSYPESNGKRNWTALIHPVRPWDGLVGSCGGIVVDHGEYWNRVKYEAERARFMLGLRDTEPCILDYGDDIKTPDSWKGETFSAKGAKQNG